MSAKSICSVLIIIGIVILFFTIKRRFRNQAVISWSESVPINGKQLEAMKLLWTAAKGTKATTPRPFSLTSLHLRLEGAKATLAPSTDPLATLSSEDLDYISTICRADYLPAYFGYSFFCNVGRLSMYEACKEVGFDERQSRILVGIVYNGYWKRLETAID